MIQSSLYSTFKENAGVEHDFDIVIEYYLNEEHMCKEYSDLKKYGITVKKTEKHPDGRVLKESKTIDGIFYRQADVTEFLDKLVRNSVTPVGFRDALEEHICGKLSSIKVMNGL